jgi:uncharacterized protein DUF4112
MPKHSALDTPFASRLATPNVKHSVSVSGDDRLRHLHWLGRLLDTAFPIPGTRYRIGLDGLLGLVPGIGDLLGTLLSSYIILAAARLGAPKQVLLRMVGNVALEGLVGLVPILGDLFDIAWKANIRNLSLLRAHLEGPGRHPRSPRRVLGLIAGALLLVVIGLTAVSVVFLRFLYQAITG